MTAQLAARFQRAIATGQTIVFEHGSLTVKFIPRSVDGNRLLLLCSSGGRIPAAPCTTIGATAGVPSGTEWRFRLADTVAYCEWPAPVEQSKVVQP
jgi:hypothetical protein